MAPDLVITFFGFLVAIYALMPRHAQLGIRIKLRRLDWMVIGLGGAFIIGLIFADVIQNIFPAARGWTFALGFTSSTAAVAALLAVIGIVAVRTRRAPLTAQRFDLFREMIMGLIARNDYSVACHLVEKAFHDLRVLAAIDAPENNQHIVQEPEKVGPGGARAAVLEFLHDFFCDKRIVVQLVQAHPALCENFLKLKGPLRQKFFLLWFEVSLDNQESPLIKQIEALTCEPGTVCDTDSLPLLNSLLIRTRENLDYEVLLAAFCALAARFGAVSSITRPATLEHPVKLSHPVVACLRLYKQAIFHLAWHCADRIYTQRPNRMRELVGSAMSLALSNGRRGFDPHMYFVDSLVRATDEAALIAAERMDKMRSDDVACESRKGEEGTATMASILAGESGALHGYKWDALAVHIADFDTMRDDQRYVIQASLYQAYALHKQSAELATRFALGLIYSRLLVCPVDLGRFIPIIESAADAFSDVKAIFISHLEQIPKASDDRIPWVMKAAAEERTAAVN